MLHLQQVKWKEPVKKIRFVAEFPSQKYRKIDEHKTTITTTEEEIFKSIPLLKSKIIKNVTSLTRR
jgi:hypothetical protein